MREKKHRLLRNLLLDILLTGVALVIFALFHHVLPRQQQSMGIVIANPYKTETPADESGGLPDGAYLIASTDRTSASTVISDVSAPVLAAKGGRSTGSGRGGTTSGQKGGSALTEDASDIGDTDEGDLTPISEKFADQYTDTVIVTENSYSSPDISITVTEETTQNGKITYYLADIYVRDITCFQSALARNTYGSGFRDSILDMAVLNDALLAVNGDYYGNTNEGVVIRNGVIYRANRTSCDVCVLYYDGSMAVMPGSAFSVEDAIADGAWQAWTFGPALLNTDGSALTSFASTGRLISANPRTAIGYYEPGHYCLVVVDGRGESAGISLPELSQLFYDLGCAAAYNLDGGNSSIMVWQDAVINAPSGGGRESSDALLIAEVNAYE
ncbi:MAG: phosphodiester glycosidase family protein [Clostridia bacterium]|nr:phosphodiester glycosidase family protein [Clostridia bacterium]